MTSRHTLTLTLASVLAALLFAQLAYAAAAPHQVLTTFKFDGTTYYFNGTRSSAQNVSSVSGYLKVGGERYSRWIGVENDSASNVSRDGLIQAGIYYYGSGSALFYELSGQPPVTFYGTALDMNDTIYLRLTRTNSSSWLVYAKDITTNRTLLSRSVAYSISGYPEWISEAQAVYGAKGFPTAPQFASAQYAPNAG